ncbi:MAG: sporulation integral membrane protein YtvI [Oscillospiraceae bacterium]|nr:sporulation integral membrane protein YtvI [Oscillospiraceae bacterium]
MNPFVRKLWILAALLAGIFLGIRYLLPLIFPFLLGGALALAADPIVRFGCTRLRLPRSVAAGIGVSMSFAFLAMIVLILAALVLRELRALAGILPALEESIRGGMQSISSRLLTLAEKAPGGIAAILSRNINELFSGGSAMLDRTSGYLLHLASGILSQVPGRALSFGTAIIASFMISAKLPKLKRALRNRLGMQKLQPFLDTLRRLRHTLVCWLKAQLKLSGVTFAVAASGLLLLRIPYAPLWAALIALVDAFPVLGTGAVLVPWSLVSFLQGDRLIAFGLLGLYAAAAVTRTVLEPRLVGKHLGLDPLVTLVALYAGFKLFGLPGMILAPMLAVTVSQLMEMKPQQ